MFMRRSKPPLLRDAVFDGYDYGLSFSYVEGLGKVLGGLGARCYKRQGHKLHNAWRVPKGRIHEDAPEFFKALKDFAGDAFEETQESFIRKLDQSREKVEGGAFAAGLNLTLARMSGGFVLAYGDFHPGLVALYKRMQGIFSKVGSAWKIRTTPETLRANIIDALGVPEDQVKVLLGEHQMLDDGAVVKTPEWDTIAVGGVMPEATGAAGEESVNEIYLASIESIRKIDWPPAKLNAALTRYELYDYQRLGVAHLIGRSSALLADDMGLGKTRQAIVAADIQSQGRQTLIITLNSLLMNWKREIEGICPGAKVAIQKYDPTAQWIVVNYEQLDRYVNLAKRFHVMVIDEAHRLKEPSAAWTRHAFNIAAAVPNRYLLTGTPVLNRESELHTLLRLSGHPIGEMPLKEFCEQFAGSSEFRSQLRARLSDWMLRRTKDVLTNLKGKQHQKLAVSLSAEERKEYQEVLRSDKTPLARIGTLRAMIERFKSKVAIDLVKDLDPEDKAIIFCEFTETVEALKSALDDLGIKSVTYTGKHSRTQRQKAEDLFQQDDSVRVFIGTTSAAGTGINLTAANYVIFTSLPWTPALQDQAEDRAYRNGQLRMVVVKIPLVEDSIDQALWNMLGAKRAVARDLIEPEPGNAEQRAMEQLAAEMLRAA
ncbi:TPA: DEAD/DEAH box helicase [Pseudomonas aeruginosa]|nr:DEAD/DEAH box helicase [Pseudomonas aeruginosa]HCF2913226.1 DEAD/DEAH box helicase [Pseudomonas aeruginosa]